MPFALSFFQNHKFIFIKIWLIKKMLVHNVKLKIRK